MGLGDKVVNRQLIRHHLTCIDALQQACSTLVADCPEAEGVPNHCAEALQTLASKIEAHSQHIRMLAVASGP